MKRIVILMLLLQSSVMSFAAIEHHNLDMTVCRALPDGSVQIGGTSEVDSSKRLIMFSKADFAEKVLDRYLSMCLTSVVSSHQLRVDYLECSGTTCTTTGNTSFNYFK